MIRVPNLVRVPRRSVPQRGIAGFNALSRCIYREAAPALPGDGYFRFASDH